MAAKAGAAECVTRAIEQGEERTMRFLSLCYRKMPLNYQKHLQVFNIITFIIINITNAFNI